MAMTPEQKAKLRRKAQAAFGEMDSELDLMNASDPFAELEEEEEVGVLTEQDQKRKVENQPPKKSLPVVSATQDSLTTALVNDEPDTRRKIYTETTRTPTGGSRFTTTDPNQTQEGFRAERAVKDIFQEMYGFKGAKTPEGIIKEMGRNNILRKLKDQHGDAAVKYFEENY